MCLCVKQTFWASNGRGFCWDQESQLHQLTTGNVAESLLSVCSPICSANVVFYVLWIAAKFPQLCSFHFLCKM